MFSDTGEDFLDLSDLSDVAQQFHCHRWNFRFRPTGNEEQREFNFHAMKTMICLFSSSRVPVLFSSRGKCFFSRRLGNEFILPCLCWTPREHHLDVHEEEEETIPKWVSRMPSNTSEIVHAVAVIHNGEYFYLQSIQPSDSGVYECVASNLYHVSISRSFFVTVQCTFRVSLSLPCLCTTHESSFRFSTYLSSE